MAKPHFYKILLVAGALALGMISIQPVLACDFNIVVKNNTKYTLKQVFVYGPPGHQTNNTYNLKPGDSFTYNVTGILCDGYFAVGTQFGGIGYKGPTAYGPNPAQKLKLKMTLCQTVVIYMQKLLDLVINKLQAATRSIFVM